MVPFPAFSFQFPPTIGTREENVRFANVLAAAAVVVVVVRTNMVVVREGGKQRSMCMFNGEECSNEKRLKKSKPNLPDDSF